MDWLDWWIECQTSPKRSVNLSRNSCPGTLTRVLLKERPDDCLPCSVNIVDTGVSVASILRAVAAVSPGSSP